MGKRKYHPSVFKVSDWGDPGHRPQENLLTAKSIIEFYSYLDITLFISFWVLSKYFDKEALRAAMDLVTCVRLG